MDAALVLSAVGATLALGGFFFGLFEYWRAQKWKRLEFVLQQVNDLEADWRVRAVLRMLDWYDTYVQLRIPGEDAKGTRVDEKLFVSALRPHGSDDTFTMEEQAIRECFDLLLDGLDRLNHYVDAGLIRFSDIRPYLRYWLDMLAQDRPGRRMMALGHYMAHYGFDGACALVELHRRHGAPRPRAAFGLPVLEQA